LARINVMTFALTSPVTLCNKSRPVAGRTRTARCRCKFRYVSNFTTASCGFSAVNYLSKVIGPKY